MRAAVAIATVASLAMGACGGGAVSEGGGGDTLSLVGFAAPKSANDDAQAAWTETADADGATWKASYGPSGDQSRAVIDGLDADYVHFSLEGDVTRLVEEGLVSADWNTGEYQGIVSQSVVVLVVRTGNPKGIEGWEDLAKPGVGIVTPNPGSSGSARWNILAAYGSVLADGGSEDDASTYLTSFFQNVAALPGGGRDATTAFVGGTGDVLVSYENEAILARQSGEDFDYVVPDETLLIENPGAVTTDADPRAESYRRFVVSEEGQAIFAARGFRPLVDGIEVEVDGANDPAEPFPTPKTLLTIADDFGGWPEANRVFFDEDAGLVTRIQQETGKT